MCRQPCLDMLAVLLAAVLLPRGGGSFRGLLTRGAYVVKTTSMQWLLTGRESVVAEIVETLKPSGKQTSTAAFGKGVLLTGESGIGKSYLAAEAVKSLQPDMHVIRLHSSMHMSKEPYGALAVFLWEDSHEDLNRPVRVLAATRRRLQSVAGGKDICLFVDNANELDSHSAIVLAQLARAGSIRLLLTCGSADPLPLELSNLVKDGHVRRLQVEPFSFPEVIKALESRLDGSLSRLAARKLWLDSGGNPLYLGTLCDDMKRSNALVNKDGVWCLDQSVADDQRIPAELFTNQLRRLTGTVGRTLEIIALARGISINTLLTIADGQDVDVLEEKGLVRIDRDHTVSITSPLLARVVRSRVPAGRSNALWEVVNASLPMLHESSSTNLGMAIWSQECGRPVEFDMMLEAARTANDRIRPRLALQVLASHPPRVALTAAIAEEVRANMILGEVSAAQQVLKSFYSSTHDEPTLGAWVSLLLTETSLLVSSRKTWAEAATNLEKVQTELYTDVFDCGVVPTGENIVALRSDLAIAKAKSAWWTGDFSSVLEELGQCILADSHDEENDALILGSQLSLAAAAAGYTARAKELAGGLGAAFSQLPATPIRETEAKQLLFFSSLIAGRLDTAEGLARGLHTQMDEEVEVHGTAFADLALPVLAVARGHGTQCMSHLLPELAQLSLRDHHGALGLALSAAAYASVLSGDVDSADRYLAELDGYSATAPWIVERMGHYFELTARGMVGDRDGSISQLIQMADTDRDSGKNYWEVLSLGHALRLGAVSVAGRLLSAVGSFEEGQWLFYRALAEGTLSRDPELFTLAAELAAEEANDAGVVDAAEAGLVLGTLTPQQQRCLAGLLDTSRRNMEISSRRARDEQSLTARQMEIAALAAAGASNKDIAASLHVSVRTVEGHLYQIFGKLRISERSDLPLVLNQVVEEWA